MQEFFRDGDIEGVILQPLVRREDERGWLVEVFREDEMVEEQMPVMGYLSHTLPGVARGPHEHREQTDTFAFLGPGDFKLYCWDVRADSPTCGNRMTRVVGESCPQRVIVPPGVIHAYKNISLVSALVVNCPNRLYAGPARKNPVDEIRHEDCENSPYVLD
ncbi:MAG: dTDP-4-dehydrorhamnose 3,5-epimerase family protein [Pirellulales bacterium]|nr:dTDP-4-dehydrorhamnose 3,5-epimerase family protein [Pirellulales bacterium]